MLTSLRCWRRCSTAAPNCSPSVARYGQSLAQRTVGNRLLYPKCNRFLTTAVAETNDKEDVLLPVASRKLSRTAQDDCHPIFKSKPEIPTFVLQAVRRELPWLKEPIKLVDRLRRVLEKKDEHYIAFAVTLIRDASRDRSCVVAWNVLVDHFASSGDIGSAFKTYNEMKKRAQFPDARTYTILLRGLAGRTDDPTSVQKALSVYHSMFATNAKVEPSIIHTNAVLEVCARAGDMDALWGVVSRIPDSGPGSADYITYTTILKALRADALEADGVEDPDMADLGTKARGDEHRLTVAVSRGRTLWGDIAHRWHQGDVRIEEGLVSTMGQLLLLSNNPSHWDDVLSMIAQVANLERQVRPWSETKRRPELSRPALSGDEPLSDEPLEDDFVDRQISQMKGSEDDVFRSPALVQSEQSNLPSRVKQKKSPLHVKLGCSSLSMLLDACLQLDLHGQFRGYGRVARSYWKLLQEEHNVVPDAENYAGYLRILRRSRASHEAVKVVVDEVPSDMLAPKMFIIAMSACVRDAHNPSCLENAVRLYQCMLEQPGVPSIKVMTQLIQLAREQPKSELAEAVIKMAMSARKEVDITSPHERRKSPFCLERWYKRNKSSAEKDRIAEAAQLLVGLIDSLPAGRIPDYRGAKTELDNIIHQHYNPSREGNQGSLRTSNRQESRNLSESRHESRAIHKVRFNEHKHSRPARKSGPKVSKYAVR